MPCPLCGSTDAAPIVYGLMDFETYMAQPGVVPGGCCVEPEDRQCRGCNTRFRSDGVASDSASAHPPLFFDL